MNSDQKRPPSDHTVGTPLASVVPPSGEAATLPPKDSPTILPQTTPQSQPRAQFRPLANQLPLEFGRYRLSKLLGEGGMGSVYLAHDTQLERSVALKVPQFGADDGTNMRQRFITEARAAATIHHANICPVYDVNETDGTIYMTMAFIEGQSLAEHLREHPAMASRDIAVLLRKVALGLEEAHRKNVVHRDLKPSNVMLTAKGEPVVMDFGLARRGGSADPRITQSGAIMGTPAYMAPEQASGIQDKIGAHCDVYSMGVMLYEMLAGELPFKGDTMGILTQVLLDEPPPPSQFRPGVDRQLEAICLKAMAKKPEARYRSMAEFADVFTEYLERRDTVNITSKTIAPAVAPPRRGFTGWLVGVAAIIVAVVTAIGIFWTTNQGTAKIQLSDPNAAVEIQIDGKRVTPATADSAIPLRAGSHTLEVTGKDFKTVTKTFSVRRRGEATIEVQLEPVAALAALVPPVPPPLPPPPPLPNPFEKAEKRQRAIVALNLAKNHQQKHETDRTIVAATKALDDDPNLVEAYLVRAKALAENERWSEAVRDCSNALKIDPKYIECYLLRAQIRIHQKLPDSAIGDCTDAMRWDKHNAALYFTRAMAYLAKKDDTRAELDFTDAIKIDAKNPQAYLERGLICARKNEDAKARADFEKAVQLSPSLAAKVPSKFTAPPPDTEWIWPADLLATSRILAPNLSKTKPLWHVTLDKPLEGLATGKVRNTQVDRNFNDGKYNIHIPVKGTIVSTVPRNWESSAFAGTGLAIQVVGSAHGVQARWGVILHPRSDSTAAERLQIVLINNGKLTIGPPSKVDELDDMTEKIVIDHPALKKVNQSNTLLVLARGRVVEVYVNGVAVAQPVPLERDVHFPQFGLFAATTRSGGATASFENITVWPVDSIPLMSKRGGVPKK